MNHKMVNLFSVLVNQANFPQSYHERRHRNHTASDEEEENSSQNIFSIPIVFVCVLIATSLIFGVIWFAYIYCLYKYRLKKSHHERQRLRAQGIVIRRMSYKHCAHQVLWRRKSRG